MSAVMSKSRTLSYTTPLQEKFINYIMERGKKSLARRLFDETLEEIKAAGKTAPMKVFEQALENVMPSMEVRPKRIGEGVYQVPIEVKPKRQVALAVRWILAAARSLKGSSFPKRLAQILMESAENTGPAIKKRDDIHRMAEANKTFAHLARFA
ncbi:30S ribosomal protein S7 [Candidatus Gracilibacteria bacterium CG17_big_fil_post_rev_8_21_14_2_50_48_13]|nr:MAG: 30S ribosomal protein S7 [Candidatus Gracilibacteria bacterium CG17_big_fil_post_rev_8_21_14_2_50_48_13]